MLFRFIYLRWALFPFTVALFFTIPALILWEWSGVALGLSATLLFLGALRFRAIRRILALLSARPLSPAEAPVVYSLVQEHSRRVGIAMPQIGLIDSDSLNVCAFGFSRKNSWIVVTRGLSEKLSRETLSAVLCREITYLWHPDFIGETWLSRFLHLMEPKGTIPFSRKQAGRGRFYPFRWFLRQILLYPLALFPAWILRSQNTAKDLDQKAMKLSRRPQALAEGYRTIESYRERIPLVVPLSVQHLFLLPPPTWDPIGRMFFEMGGLRAQIREIEMQKKVLVIS